MSNTTCQYEAWREAEDDYLFEQWYHPQDRPKTVNELAKILDRSPGAIESRLAKFEFARKWQSRFTDSQTLVTPTRRRKMNNQQLMTIVIVVGLIALACIGIFA